MPPYTTRVWQQKEGAPSNVITGLCQDRRGYLWVATPEGLARFDGTRFVALAIAPDSPAEAGFNALLPDPTGDGLLLALRTGGMLRLVHDQFEPYALPAPIAQRTITGLYTAPDGALWIACDGGFALRHAANADHLFGPPDGIPSDQSVQFAHDGEGRTWLAAGTWLARCEGEKLLPLVPRPRTDPLRIASARQDGPWIIADQELMKIVGDAAKDIGRLNARAGAPYAQGFLEDANGILWIATRSRGLSRVSPKDADALRVITTPEDIASLIEDRAGNLWSGTNGGGLIRLKAGVLRSYDRSQGLLENHSLTVTQDLSDGMWFANRDGGVAFLTPAGRIATVPLAGDGWKNFSAVSLSPAVEGGVWATSSRGLIRVTRSRVVEHLPLPDAALNAEVRVTFSSRNGDLWLALGPGALGRVRRSQLTVFGPEQGLARFTIRALAEDANGRLCVGGDRGAYFRQEAELFVPVPLSDAASIGAVQAIALDPQGGTWLGTERGGLLHFDATGVRFVNEAQGLSSNNIAQIVCDDTGRLWCGSPSGIFHVPLAELQRLLDRQVPRIYPVSIGLDEGLPEATCLSGCQPAAWKSRDGLLWFATRQGVVAIDPRREQNFPKTITAKIIAVEDDGQNHATDRHVRIAANPHTVEVQYSVLCLSTPERVRVRHRLVGYDDEWTNASVDGIARFTRLPPGNYRFELSALLAGVSGSTVSETIQITVESSWLQTIWFKLALGLGGATALGLAVRTRSHRRLRARLAQLERDSALERERARIAQNIHDDLGAGLTRISLLTQSTQADGSQQLDKIYHTVSELTQSMDEIVWAVNPKNDDLESLANYIVEFAQGFLADAGIRCRVELPALLPHHTLTTQYRHHLFLGCKEALNNIVKHAGATEVALRLNVEAGRVRLVIADNGRGFSPAVASTSTGLASMRARMAALGGACEISAVAPHGTAVTLSAVLPTPLSPR